MTCSFQNCLGQHELKSKKSSVVLEDHLLFPSFLQSALLNLIPTKERLVEPIHLCISISRYESGGVAATYGEVDYSRLKNHLDMKNLSPIFPPAASSVLLVIYASRQSILIKGWINEWVYWHFWDCNKVLFYYYYVHKIWDESAIAFIREALLPKQVAAKIHYSCALDLTM